MNDYFFTMSNLMMDTQLYKSAWWMKASNMIAYRKQHKQPKEHIHLETVLEYHITPLRHLKKTTQKLLSTLQMTVTNRHIITNTFFCMTMQRHNSTAATHHVHT